MMLFLSFMNLFRNYRRTIAILLTVAIGTGVLFSFKGFINGVLNQYKDNTIHSHYGHGQVYTKDYRETVFNDPWNHWITNWEEIHTYLGRHEGVKDVYPRVNFPALLKKGNTTVSGYGQGIEAEKESEFFYGLNIEVGNQLTTEKDGIVLGIGLAKALNVVPGDSVTLQVNSIDATPSQKDLIVTGIFHTGSLEFDSKIFRLQIQQAQELLKTSKIELIAIGLKESTDWNEFAADFNKNFPELDIISFAVLDKVYYQHSVDWLSAQFQVIQMIILAIVLLGIFNSISAAILERKQEIGNFRANGESILNVLQLIIMEGAFLGILGSMLGMLLAFIALTLLDNQIEMPPGPGLTRPFFISFQFQWQMVYTSLAMAATASVVASALAGFRVANMPIAKALRSY